MSANSLKKKPQLPSIHFIHVENSSLTAFINNRPHHITASHQHFALILDKLTTGNYDGLEALVASPEARVNALVEAAGGDRDLYIENGEAFYKGRPLNNELGRMLVSQLENDYSIPGFVKFASKVCQNPTLNSVDALYLFLRDAQMPICEDGDFLAYKKVAFDYKDLDCGVFSSEPGSVVSGGVGHSFCSYSFLPSYQRLSNGSRVVIVKINPADVVSIPAHHSSDKGFTHRYESIAELPEWRDTPAGSGEVPGAYVPADYGYDDGTEDNWCDECDCRFSQCPCVA